MKPGGQFARLIAEASKHNVPLEASLEITHRCNFGCQHCYMPDFSSRDRLSTERILRLLHELADMGTLFLTLTGGEMLLRRDWLRIARAARTLGFKLRLFSNASLITPARADAIRELEAGIEISLYSMDPEVFERITGRKGSFARTVRGICLLRERDIEVLLKVPIMTLNWGVIGEVFEFAESIGADCRADHKIVHKRDGDRSPQRLEVPGRLLLSYFRGPYSRCSRPGEGNGAAADGPLCAAASRFVSITAAGEVLACNIMPGSGGNILESGFHEIWEASPWLNHVRSIRRKDLPACRECPKISYCGRCHAQALVEEGDMRLPQRSACAHAETLEEAFAR